LKLNGTLQFLVYVDNVNILGGSVLNVKVNTESLVRASKESALVVNADKSTYKVLYRDQNVGRSYSVKIENICLEIVKEFKYLVITLTKTVCIMEEIKSLLKSGNACCHAVQIVRFPVCYPISED